MHRILVVDDELGWREVCRDTLETSRLRVDTAGTVREAQRKLKENDYGLLVADLRMPGENAMDLVAEVGKTLPELVTIVITGFPEIETAVSAIKHGAFDYLPKPFSPDQLKIAADRALEQRRLRDENRFLAHHLTRSYGDHTIIGHSEAIERVFSIIGQVGPADCDVLLTGQSGTGKEAVARAIHGASPRKKRRFVPVDCAAIPDQLFESELFGHEKGAFTGASRARGGLIQYAEGGTLFLDEIGEISPNTQAKFLRVIQERKYRRVGSESLNQADIRVVAATNRDLAEDVRCGRFRGDLYFRLRVFDIKLPALRKRGDDLWLLSEHFLALYSREIGKEVTSLSPEVRRIFRKYRWPGNIRELKHSIKRAVILASGATVEVDQLPPAIIDAVGGPEGKPGFHGLRAATIEQFEREYLEGMLRDCAGNVAKACRISGLSRSSLYFLLKRYLLKPEDFRGAG